MVHRVILKRLFFFKIFLAAIFVFIALRVGWSGLEINSGNEKQFPVYKVKLPKIVKNPSDIGVGSETKRILLINSYHQGLSWTDAITTQIEESFSQIENCQIFTEYLDSKRVKFKSISGQFLDFLRDKFSAARPDIIIVSDNNAFEFIQNQGQEIFAGIPVIFCGVNNFSESMLKIPELTSGVVEKTDPYKTFLLMKSLQPNLKKCVIVTDNTSTGQAELDVSKRIFGEFREGVKFEYWVSLPKNELLNKLSKIDSLQESVLLILYNNDPDGNFFSYEESGKFISKATKSPVYSLWDFYLNTGVLGGDVASGKMQGQLAAQLAIRVLSGEKISSIPIVTNSPNVKVLDFDAMKKLGINFSFVPENTSFINVPKNWFWDHRITASFFLLMMIFEALALIFLGWLLARSHNESRQELEIRENKFRELFETNLTGIAIHKVLYNEEKQPIDYVFVNCNPAFLELTGLNEVIGKKVTEVIPGISKTPLINIYAKVAESGKSFTFEHYSKDLDRHFLINAFPFGEDGFATAFLNITKQKRVEHILTQSKLETERILDSIQSGVMLVDCETRIVLNANPAACKMIGAARSEIIGRVCHCFVCPAERNSCPALDLGQIVDNSERILIRKNGDRLPILKTVVPIKLEGKECLLESFVDISQLIDLQRILRDERDLFLAGPTMVFRWSATIGWPIEYASPNVKDILGYTSEELLSGNPIYPEMIHPEDLKKITKEVAEYTEMGKSHFEHSPYRLLKKNGDSVWISDYTTVVRDDDGKPIQYLGYLVDITESRQQAIELEGERKRLDLVIKGTNAGFWDWDISTDEIFVNSRWAEIIGYSIEDFSSLNFNLFKEKVHPEDISNIEEILQKHIESESFEYEVDFRMKHKNSNWVWIRAVGAIVERTKDGSPLRMVGTHSDIDQKKRAQEKFNELTRRIQLATDSAQIGIWEIDIPQNKMYWDDRMLDFYGITREDYTTEFESWQLGLYLDYTKKISEFSSEEKVERRIETEFKIMRPTGEIRYIKAFALVEFDENGKALSLTGANMDVTDQVESQIRLQESEDNFRTFFETTEDMVFVATRQEKIVFANQAGIEKLGYQLEDLLKMSLKDLFADENRSEAGNDFAAILSGNKEVCNIPLLRASGNSLDVETRLWSGKWNGSDCLYAVTKDITPLREALQKFQQMFDSNPSLMTVSAIKGTESRFVEVNQAFLNKMGYSRDEVIGRNIKQIPIFSAFDRQFELAEELLSSGSIRNKEVQVKTKSGSILNGLVSAVIVENQQETLLLTVMTDVTEQEIAKEQLKEALRFLSELNFDLENANAKAREMALSAESANTAKSEFLANMSHEIRTPMNGVIGMTSLLLDTELDDEQRRYAVTVKNSGESLLSLINDILDFSKIEAGKLELHIEKFDLRDIFENLATMMAVNATEKKLDLVNIINPDVPRFVIGDPNRIRQVLINLVGNAIKFTDEGKVVVRIATEASGENEVTLCAFIEDTGIGISEDDQKLLFSKFSQVDPSSTRKFGGTGLGLAICKQLVDLMGGSIGVSSDIGVGSKFWFSLRLQLPEEESIVSSHSKETFEDISVLIVDGNPDSLLETDSLLKFLGVKTIPVSDSIQALKVVSEIAAEGTPAQFAFIDIYLPRMDGMALGQAIKSDEKLSKMNLILTSTLRQRVDKKRLISCGFSGFVQKPLRESEILDILNGKRKAISGAVEVQTSFKQEGLKEFSKSRILLAEDNITNQQVAMGILNKMGLNTDPVVNGSEVLKALKVFKYDLILMDIQMPEMDGLEATRIIRNGGAGVENSKIPIVALTAHALQGDRERCIDAGTNDYLSKPINPLQLLEKIKFWLKKGLKQKEDSAEIDAKKLSEGRKKVDGSDINSDCFDVSTLMGRMMGDRELAESIVRCFLEDTPAQVVELNRSLNDENVKEVALIAHSIKGASSNVGGEGLRKLAFDIERAAKSGNLALAKELAKELENSYTELKNAMLDWIE